MNNQQIYFGMSLLAGGLLWLAWPPFSIPVLFFIAWIPLLWIERELSLTNPTYRKSRLLQYSYLTFLVWNALTTWWIWNATPGGALFAIVANAALMCAPFMLFHVTKRYTGKIIGYLSLPVYWVAFEHIHHVWDLSWPWLTLGNGLAAYPTWMQWYEYTGHLGGSVWIWGANILLFIALQQKFWKGSLSRIFRKASPVASWIIIPICLSLVLYYSYQPKGKTIDVTIVQPNIDPYAKFESLTDQEQLEHHLQLSKQNIDPQTDLLLWPESAVQHRVWVNQMDSNKAILQLRDFLKPYPNLNLLTGFSPFEHYSSEQAAPPLAYEFRDGEFYNIYNSALLMSKNNPLQYYHKSKLVPGVERFPYPQVTKYLKPLMMDIAGFVGNYGTQEERTVMTAGKNVRVAPAICYESIYGAFMSRYIRNGANLITIITNDGWWGNTPGHQQHMLYASMRAIENRRSIARCANTGISGFINQRGEIRKATPYWEERVLRDKVRLNKQLTFYSRYGGYLGQTACLGSIIFIFICIGFRIQKRGAKSGN